MPLQYLTVYKHKLLELEQQHKQMKETHEQMEQQLLMKRTSHEETQLQLRNTRSSQERTQQALKGKFIFGENSKLHVFSIIFFSYAHMIIMTLFYTAWNMLWPICLNM